MSKSFLCPEVHTNSAVLSVQALNDTVSGELRRTALEAIVSAQTVLRNETKLFELIDGLSKDQVCGLYT